MNDASDTYAAMTGSHRADSKSLHLLEIFLALCVSATLLGCAQKDAAGNQDPPVIPVKIIVVQSVPTADSSDYLATLKSRHSTVLNPQVEGQITHIFVKSGDRVTSGTPLLEIDPLKQQATVGSEDAARGAQVANVQLAQIQWERSQKLFDAGVISKQEFDQARTNLDTAQQQLKSLEAQVREQQVQLRYYTVTAPTDGIVGDIPVRIGDRVTNSTLLTTVDEPGNLEIYINVPVERSKDLKLGQAVQLIDPSGHITAESHIDFISREVDNSTQSVLVKATVRNGSGALRTSQFASARIIWGVHEGLVIPVLAVSRINGQFFAFIVEGSGKSAVARQKMVRLADLANNTYAVLDGLKLGEHVVVEGGQNLTDGSPVAETVENSSGKPTP